MLLSYFSTTGRAVRRIEQTLKRHSLLLNLLLRGEIKIMSALTDAIDAAELAAEADAAADSAAMGLLVTLSDLLKQAVAEGTDPAQTARVKAIADQMALRAEALASAVVAHTPAEPAPTDPGTG